jgi:hypothetical protein
MLYFHTKNFQTKTPILIFFVSPRRRKFCSFFPGFGMLYQEKSGNPVVAYFGKTRQQK